MTNWLAISAVALNMNMAAADPEASVRFFSTGSPWNVPISSASTYVLTEPKIATLAVGLSTWPDSSDFALPIYESSISDPLHPVLYAETWQNLYDQKWKTSGNDRATESAILAKSKPTFPSPGNTYSSQSPTAYVLPPYYDKLMNPTKPPARFHLPANAVPAPGNDAPIAVVQPDGRVLEAYGAIRLSTGELVALRYQLSDGRGDGTGYANGTTASMLPVYAGVIRDQELSSGKIDHAMKIAVPRGALVTKFVYPALTMDRNAATSGTPYSGKLPMGSRLASPRSVALASLGLKTPVGQMIGTAAQLYGFIICDAGGGGITIQIERRAKTGGVDQWDNDLRADLRAIMKQVQTVTIR